MVIGKDGKMVVIKYSGLWRNVTKIYITRIQGLPGDGSDRNEDDSKDTEIKLS